MQRANFSATSKGDRSLPATSPAVARRDYLIGLSDSETLPEPLKALLEDDLKRSRERAKEVQSSRAESPEDSA